MCTGHGKVREVFCQIGGGSQITDQGMALVGMQTLGDLGAGDQRKWGTDVDGDERNPVAGLRQTFDEPTFFFGMSTTQSNDLDRAGLKPSGEVAEGAQVGVPAIVIAPGW